MQYSAKHASSKPTVRIFDDGGVPNVAHNRKRSVGASQKMVTNHVNKQLKYINGADQLHPYVSQEATNMMKARL